MLQKKSPQRHPPAAQPSAARRASGQLQRPRRFRHCFLLMISVTDPTGFAVAFVAAWMLALAMLVIWLATAVMLSNALFVCSSMFFITFAITSLPSTAEDFLCSIADAADFVSCV